MNQQNERITDFSNFLVYLLNRIKQKNTPYINLDVVTKDIEELQNRYKQCFGFYSEFLYDINCNWNWL